MNTPIEPKSLSDFLLITGFLTSLAVNLLTVTKLLRNDPQRREVTLRSRFTTADETNDLRNDLESLCTQVRQDRDEILRAGEQRAHELHRRIDAINEEMPWKIINLLRSSGALK
jgi:hypothetical protein